MQFMAFAREVYACIDGMWQQCLGINAEGMVLVDANGKQKILHHGLVLREDLLWPV